MIDVSVIIFLIADSRKMILLIQLQLLDLRFALLGSAHISKCETYFFSTASQ